MTEQISKEYLQEHPEHIDDYVKQCFRNFSDDGSVEGLISSLRMIARAQGISAFPTEDDPRVENVNAMIQAIGYRLSFEPIEAFAGR